MNPLSFIAPATTARRGARKDAEKFAATLKPGHTYYSIVDLHRSHPGMPARALHTWTFSAASFWNGYMPRAGSMGAATAWLGYGPLHESRPRGLKTFAELARQPGLDLAEMLREADAVPAGV